MDALLDAVHTFFATVLAWMALPPMWTHAALHRSVGTYIRHAPSTLPFPFDIIFGGWEGLPDADVCSRLTSFSAYSMAHMQLACEDRIYRYIDGRVHVVIAAVVIFTTFSFLYKTPNAVAAVLRLMNPMSEKPGKPIPAGKRALRTDQQKALEAANRAEYLRMRREHPTLLNFILSFREKVEQYPRMQIRQFWQDFAQPNLRALVPAVRIEVPVEPVENAIVDGEN